MSLKKQTLLEHFFHILREKIVAFVLLCLLLKGIYTFGEKVWNRSVSEFFFLFGCYIFEWHFLRILHPEGEISLHPAWLVLKMSLDGGLTCVDKLSRVGCLVMTRLGFDSTSLAFFAAADHFAHPCPHTVTALAVWSPGLKLTPPWKMNKCGCIWRKIMITRNIYSGMWWERNCWGFWVNIVYQHWWGKLIYDWWIIYSNALF